jgi:stage IV sporulation protein FB
MKIEINLKIILMIIVFFLLKSVDTYVIFLIFVFLHELAHLIVGVLIGGKPKSITCMPLGFSLEFYSYGKSKTFYKILFYLIGPLVNFIFAFIFLKLNIENELKFKIIYTNLAVGIFNLIPILPLDGGKILKEILKKIIGFEKANDFIIHFSKAFLFIITFLYAILIVKVKNVYILMVLAYLWYLYIIEEKNYNILKRTQDVIKNINN